MVVAGSQHIEKPASLMFEFDQYRALEPSAAIRPTANLTFFSGVKKRALLVWSEHCVECAAPECYQTCDLYKPRPDNRCRRFEVGMRRNKNFRGNTGAAADIVFGKWGKLEARGNTVLFRNRVVSLVESVVPRLLPLVNALGRIVRRFGGSAPWTSLAFELLDATSKRLFKASDSNESPDAFLIEIYNPASLQCKLKFSCTVAGADMLSIPKTGKLVLPYWKQLILAPGYNQYLIPYRDLSAIVESRLRYNLSFTPDQEFGTQLVFISADFITLENPASMLPAQANSTEVSPPVKCVVFDLDNTVWDGVLVEGEVKLNPIIPDLFHSLDKRGILISVASKNNESQALERLAELDLAEYLTCPVINWKQKSQNINWLAEKLSIGTDALLFVDDSAFEREEVATGVADIEVLSETAIETLLEHPRLQGSRTTESGNRRVMYRQQEQRREAAVEFGADYLAFLKSSEIVVTMGDVAENQFERVAELLQRTNQLNFSGTKYSRDAVDGLLRDTETDKHVIQCKDKYGDYGLVGFAITRVSQGSISVQDFMLSCRVQGKLIEKAFFSYLVNKYASGMVTLSVNFVATNRNGLAESVLREIGFDTATGKPVTLTVKPDQLDVDFLELRTDESA